MKFIYPNYDLGKEPSKNVVEVVDFFKSKKVKKILDYRCGNGRNSLFLAKKGFLVSAIDYEAFIKNLKEIVKNNVNLTLYKINDTDNVLPFSSNMFDAVLAWRILHRGLYKERTDVLKELKRVLKDRKYLLCVVSSVEDIKNDIKRRPHIEVEERTYRYKSKDVVNIRHYFTKKEISSGNAFPGFKILSINKIQEKTGHKNKNYMRHYWMVLAQKV